MNKLVLVGRTLLGLAFAFFGAAKLFQFLPAPPPMPEAAQAFSTAMAETGYMMPMIGVVELLAGVLILSGWFVPFGLVLLAPVTVNILAFHVFLDPAIERGVPAYALTALHLFVGLAYVKEFGCLFAAKPAQ